jgi:hypothetical protein
MNWLYILLLLGAALAIGRIVLQLRRLRNHREDDWDARLVEKLRRSGGDPFKPRDLDFFVGMPDETSAQRIAQRLTADGFTVDVRPVEEGGSHPYSVHITKTMSLSVTEVRAVSTRLREMAEASGGRYDGWTAGRRPEA